jgi:outer membrane protein assembly factor BamB
MHRFGLLALGALALCGGSGPARAANWPQFRGPDGAGVAEVDDFPSVFGPDTNVLWQANLAPGNSSPCIWGDRVFLTAFSDPNLETICLDRTTGRVVWRRTAPADKVDPAGLRANPAAPTPATDGARVYAYFGAFGLLCYDLDGGTVWQRALPLPVTQHGVGSSPVLAGDLVVLARDQDIGSHLLALDKRNGKTVWQTERASFRRGFATPLVWETGGQRLLVVSGTLQAVAYRLADGLEQWRASGLPNELCSSPVAAGGLVYVAGWTYGSGVARMPAFDDLVGQFDANQDGKLSRDEARDGPAKQHFLYIDADKNGVITRAEYDSMADIFTRSENALLAIRAGGTGDVTASHVVWKQKRGLPYVPCPLLYRDRLYLVRNGGLVSCLNPASGVPFYQEERLGALGDYYTSPVAANGKICVISQPGVAVVFAAGDTLQVLARNELRQPVMATPAIADGTLYVRTQGSLFAFRGTTSP